MKIERVIGKTNNTKCHSCWKKLGGEAYTRFSQFTTGLYGKDVNMSLCDKCMDKAVKVSQKEAKA